MTSTNDSAVDDRRDGGLLAWQWRHYPEGHTDRRNLVLHLLSVPLFLAGTSSLALGVATLWWPGLLGVAAMGAAVAIQGRGHRRERTPPIAFRGPFDVVARLFVEQFVTFPRFVFTGGLTRAWRASSDRR